MYFVKLIQNTPNSFDINARGWVALRAVNIRRVAGNAGAVAERGGRGWASDGRQSSTCGLQSLMTRTCPSAPPAKSLRRWAGPSLTLETNSSHLHSDSTTHVHDSRRRSTWQRRPKFSARDGLIALKISITCHETKGGA